MLDVVVHAQNLIYHRERAKQEVGEAEFEAILGNLEPLPSQRGMELRGGVFAQHVEGPGFKTAKQNHRRPNPHNPVRPFETKDRV